jgi:hypothetical protein
MAGHCDPPPCLMAPVGISDGARAWQVGSRTSRVRASRARCRTTPGGGLRARRAGRPPGWERSAMVVSCIVALACTVRVRSCGERDGVTAGQDEEPCGYRGRHESTLLSRQPWRDQERKASAHKLVDELCKYPGWRCDTRRRAVVSLAVPLADYQRKWRVTRWAAGKIPKGIAIVPASDSYPHVTCGRG